MQWKRIDELKLKDMKMKNYFFQAIYQTILETILVKDTSKQIWESMKKKYEEAFELGCIIFELEQEYWNIRKIPKHDGTKGKATKLESKL